MGGNNHSVHFKDSSSHKVTTNGITDKPEVQLIPIEKLSKILQQRTAKETSQQGINCRTFIRYLFPKYFDFGTLLFEYFLACSGSTNSDILSQSQFKHQTERVINILQDENQIELYLKVYARGKEDVTPEVFRDMMLMSFKLAMDFYPEGPQSCKQLFKMIQSVVNSAFHRKQHLSISFLTHWIMQHIPRAVMGMHRYIVHIFTTAYRNFNHKEEDDSPVGLDLSTPVLERESNFEADDETMLPVSEVWLLAISLPLSYMKPSEHRSPANNAMGLSTYSFVAKLLGSICPSHWVMLYDSNEHGLGANRFMHHVLSYRGSTLTFFRGEDDVRFCIGSPTEWKESHQYWGTEDSIIIQILPNYHIIEKGPKMLYFNTSIRGYPKGLAAGSDPRSPVIKVDDGFSIITFHSIPYPIVSVEVWGCGTEQARDLQLNIKKWQIKQIEKQRQVKINSSDWVDHPDRYLLELAGRPSYSSS